MFDDLKERWRAAVCEGKVQCTYEPLNVLLTFKSFDNHTIELPRGTVLITGVEDKSGSCQLFAAIKGGADLPVAHLRKQLPNSPFYVDFNELRRIRPRVPSTQRPNLSCSFCGPGPMSLRNRPLFATVPAPNLFWNAYGNAAIIEPEGHFLMVPSSKDGVLLKHVPQQLTQAALVDMAALHQSQKQQFITFFNSMAAGGSQDHLHIQMVLKTHVYAIEQQTPGTDPRTGSYPATKITVSADAAETLYPQISQLQSTARPFNIVFVDQQAHLFVRRRPNDPSLEWASHFASLELVGHFVCDDYSTFAQRTADDFSVALAATTEAYEL